jgi:hypothetical protein
MLSAVSLNAQVSLRASGSKYASIPAYPLKVSANGRYLVDQKNAPFLIAGDSPQGLMARLSEEDAEMYFADRQANGFNAMGWINVLCAGSDFPDNPTGATVDGIVPFTGYLHEGKDRQHYDLATPNEAYFRRLDRMVALAQKHGLLVFLNPIETVGWLPTLRENGEATDFEYGRFLGKRYKDFANVAWISGNDFSRWTNVDDDAAVLSVARGIKSVAPDQLQTVELHVHTSSSYEDPRWLPINSLNSTYTYGGTYIQMLLAYNQIPAVPTYLAEGHYELESVGEPKDFGTPSVLRRQEYWTLLSGGAGEFYGNLYTWTFKRGWQSHLDTQGAAELKIWKELFSSLPWYDLVPDQEHSVVVDGLGTRGDLDTPPSKDNYCLAARTKEGSLVVVYIPTARTITVNMTVLKAPLQARWFDPTSGVYQEVSGAISKSKGRRDFTPPGKNSKGDSDWVLVLNTPDRAIATH